MKINLYSVLFAVISTVQAQNLCSPSPCVNNGACFVDPLNDEFGYICICPQGFEGQNCEEETDECDPNPCQNGGSCTDEFLTFSCECPPGFSGEECEFEINECDSDPCQNGGTCSDGILSFSCECPPGFNGDECQFETNECDSVPCQNGGTCADQFLAFTCTCSLGFNGDECQFALPVLRFAPVLVTATATSVTTRWNAWNPSIDRGDPPVVAYIPYYKEAASQEWISGTVVLSGENPEYQADDLEADTEYSFSVAAVREGVNGEGARSPSATLRTKCDVSLEKTPVGVKTIFNTATKQLNISWQNPDDIMCSSGISSFSVYYKNESSNNGAEFLTTADEDVNWILIDIVDLLGEGEFSFYVSLTVERESDLSSASEKIVITKSVQEEPTSPGSSFIVIFIIIIILVLVISICVFLVVWYMRKGSNLSSNNAERVDYDNKAVS